MPSDESGRSGSGYDPKTRLDLPPITGDLNEPVSRGEMADILKLLKDWSGRLQFGRVGFSVEMLPLSDLDAVTDEVVQFNHVIEDSHSYHLTYMPGDELKYYQIPPGLGRVYNISYSMEFAVIEEIADVFNFTGATQTWTAPAGILFRTAHIECKGGAGNYTPASVQARRGFGCVVAASFNTIAAGTILSVDVGEGNVSNGTGWPNGGDKAASGGSGSSGAGGGSTSVRVQGNTFAQSLIVAGGGGGPGRGTVNPPALQYGGDANFLVGSPGQATTNALNAQGGTQSAGGAAGTGGEAGDTDGQGFGGDAPASGNSFAFSGGGGGGGWHGGGSGGTAVSAGNQGGGGAGGSSKINGGFNQSHTDAGNTGTGQATITYHEATAAADTDVTTAVWVAYALWPDKDPYEHVIQILGDSGASPQNASVSVPLGEGDRVWMTYTNAEADMGIINFTFNVYATGM